MKKLLTFVIVVVALAGVALLSLLILLPIGVAYRMQRRR